MAEQNNKGNNKGLRLFNTLTGQLEPFVPVDPKGERVNMYVCGPTVYDDAHLGHARCYITWDVLFRFLKFTGYNVRYVRNVTDVDDKILNRAKERGETPAELAERNYKSFIEDMAALNVLSPTDEPRATQYIQHMLEGIEALIAKGAAYTTPDGSAYFRVAAKADYGKLKYATQNVDVLKRHLDDLKSGARVEVDEGKESPLDFALWKAVPLTDPNGWESPWPTKGSAKGWGRPGWHMECSAMNHALFGAQIDIHAGGADLIFPHHENEIAQSEAWTGQQPFSKFWLHNGFVNVSGEKMSKSLGNFSTIKKLLERYDANTIRHFLLTNGYRMQVDFNEEALQSSENWVHNRLEPRLKRVYETLKLNSDDLCALRFPTVLDVHSERQKQEAAGQLPLYQELVDFADILARDLNTPKALDRLNRILADLTGTSVEWQKVLLQYAVNMLYVLGFSLDFLSAPTELPLEAIRTVYKEITGQELAGDQAATEGVKTIVSIRKQAKARKDWSQADAIRKHFTDIGLQILDNKDGTTTVEKDGLEIVRV